MRTSKLLLLGAILVGICSTQVIAVTDIYVSDPTDPDLNIVGVYNKAGGTSTFVDLSGTPMAAVDANEPMTWAGDPPPNTVYSDGPAAGSIWDSGVAPTYDFATQAPGANWIWETAASEDPNAVYSPSDDLYDLAASTWGRVVVIQQDFYIDGTPSDSNLRIAADNCWEVWINDADWSESSLAHSATAKTAQWWLSDLSEANVGSEGWQTAVGNVTIPAASLVSGWNTLTILVGNEFYSYESPYEYNNTAQPVYYNDDYYRQLNPGAAIFKLTVNYEQVPETYSICGTKMLQLVDEEGEFLEDEGPGEDWEIYLEWWDGDSWEPYASTFTDEYGDYCFNELSAGEYRVTEASYPGWTQVLPYDDTQTGDEYAYLISLPDGASPGTYYDFLNEEVYVEVEGYCGLTQGFYGNAGGKFYLPPDFEIGIPTTELLVELLDAADAVTPGSDPVVVGEDGIASLTFDTAACIIELLPASGTPALLPEDDLDCHDNLVAAGLVKKNKPELNNVLIGQIVALTLNTRLDENLGDFELPGTEEEDGVFCTAYEGGCPQQFIIPKEVMEILGEGATVYDLLDLANAAIAEGAPKKLLSAINVAITSINEAFDECALLVSCSTEEICGDGIDNDCDGYVDGDDLDCQIIE